MPNPSPTPCIAPVATQKRLCVSVVHDTTNGNQRETNTGFFKPDLTLDCWKIVFLRCSSEQVFSNSIQNA